MYRAVNADTKQVVAIKALDLDLVRNEVADVQHEVALLAQLSSSAKNNITKYYGSYLQGTTLWIIMDLCAGGSVRTLLKAGPLTDKYISVILRELLVAIVHIHREGIIHRDVKAANILITTEGQLRLCDFGVAAETNANKSKRTTIVGTPYWMAPEVVTEGASYNNKADIWSIGVTLYEMATGNPPYSDQEVMRALMMIQKGKPPRLEGPQYSQLLKDAVALCLDENPEERPSALELSKHKFVRAHQRTPPSVLKDLIARYKAWKTKNAHARDSSLMLDQELLDRLHGADQSNEKGQEEELIWDLDLDTDENNYVVQEERDFMDEAPPSLQEIFGYSSSENTEQFFRFPRPSSPLRYANGTNSIAANNSSTGSSSSSATASVAAATSASASASFSSGPVNPALPTQTLPFVANYAPAAPFALPLSPRLRATTVTTPTVKAYPAPPVLSRQSSLPPVSSVSKCDLEAPQTPHLDVSESVESPTYTFPQIPVGSQGDAQYSAANNTTNSTVNSAANGIANSVQSTALKFPHTQEVPTRLNRSRTNVQSSPSPPLRRARVPLRLVLPQQQCFSTSEQISEFPMVPPFDFSVMLDKAPPEDLQRQLSSVLDSFASACRCIGNSISPSMGQSSTK